MQLLETQHLAFTNTADSSYTFGVGLADPSMGVQKIILRTAADCYVDFDTPATSNTGFLLKATDTQPFEFNFSGGSVKTVHAIGVSSGGTLYIIGIRN
jgi:hypothetical protein